MKTLEDKIGFPVLVPPEPLITGALGAALLGKVLAARGVVRDHKRKMEEVTFFK